jgi:hypothetical protein
MRLSIVEQKHANTTKQLQHYSHILVSLAKHARVVKLARRKVQD